MSLNKNLVKNLIDITSKAAISCYPFLGKENKYEIDKAATDVMRFNLNNLNINGEVVIGEGELDEAPMLYIGEKIGKQNGLQIDIAVDPVEGTNFVAKNLPGAISVIAISEKGNLFKAPETYMNKIAYGKDIPREVIDLDNSIEKNIKNLSEFKNKKIKDISVCLLNRKRHEKIIDSLNKLGAKIKLISDGDVAGALLVSDKKYDVDIFVGIGGGPEGVIAASALDAMKCNFQGRFIFEKDLEKSRAEEMGIVDFNKKYEISEIIKGDTIFCATGITTSDLINGIKKEGKYFHTETLVTHKSQNLVKKIRKKYIFE
ncbi:class II fructose-bisphosphatase [Candidatus Pelagibacter sp.]|nr:class II fructose-bisphosphatase [Candidatus Pelagibacter sp.]